MSKKNKKNNCIDNLYDNPEIPPCSKYLGNSNPILTDYFTMYINENRTFYFLSTNPLNNVNTIGANLIYTNLQISLTNYIIGVYIYNLQCGKCSFNKNSKIHNDKKANEFIINTLNNSPKVTLNYLPSLNLIVSNGNAIIPLYTNTVNITPLNYYIILGLHALENNPALFYGNNSYALENPINIDLASYALKFQNL